MLDVIACATRQHDLGLVALSACICLLGCFSTVSLAAQAEMACARLAWRWLAGAMVLFGCSVWSLHFVAMLAFLPAATVAYDTVLTLMSAATAILGALVSLVAWRAAAGRTGGRLCAGVLLGGAITGMHYLGAWAMAHRSLIAFDAGTVTASVVIGVACASLALVRARHLDRLARRLEVTVWLALAICGLHFTGMSATSVVPLAAPDHGPSVLGSPQLALIVGLVSLGILTAGLVAILMQQHLSRRRLDELARMRLLGDLAHEVLLIHRDGHVLEINSAGSRLFGMPAQEMLGTPVAGLFAEHEGPALLRRSLCAPLDRTAEEFEVRAAGGTLVPVEMSCRAIEYFGRPATAVALRNLTDRRRDEARIRRLALHDALTDLPNRGLLEQRLAHAVDAAAGKGGGLAVVYLDLDRFKPVNDRYGHAVGDALLVEAAKRMQAALHPKDTLARIGGDEFVALLIDVGPPSEVAAAAARLIEALHHPFRVGEHRVEIGASAGIALYPADGGTPGALLRAADTALYRIKGEGRGAVRFFEASMDAQIQALQQLEHELAGALDRGELRLDYQPIVNAGTGEIETFEALIRWLHPARGLISPAEFIPIAERSELIARIGGWVIETACAAAVAWPRPWRVSVNISPSQFRLSDIPAIVADALGRTGLAPNRFVVEITEGVFIQDADKAVAVLEGLRARGVRLALDDFGTGYSSLSYLQRFKFDKIKIDRSFVRRLGEHADTLTIVHAIVNLAHNLGMQVVVEGIETIDQLVILRELGCEQMQGYLFGRPAPDPILSELEQARIRAMMLSVTRRLHA